jgi:mannose-6-phosphate isomerase
MRKMNAYPLLFTPTYHQRIWGGIRLRTLFGYPIPSEQTGEAWVISDHPNGRTAIANGVYRGKTIHELLLEQPDWFAPERLERFPLLVKLLDANDHLSVQVHPDDRFAAEHENGELGKAECWYVVHAEPGAEIIYGHTARTRAELAEMIAAGKWDKLLNRVPVHTGDFFYIPHGTIHALGKGIVVLEIQQNSDATYRAYDYDRVDRTGRKRELHIEKVLQVTNVPDLQVKVEAKTADSQSLQVTQFLRSPFFTVERWKLYGSRDERSKDYFALISVLEGSARLEWADGDLTLRKGDHLLIPRKLGRYRLVGEMEAILSYPPSRTASLPLAG